MAKSNSALLRDEYGDWQTNYPLALSVCQMLKNKGINPQVIIEPTCGKGNFILAALETFNTLEHVIGIEINAEYLSELKQKLDGRTPSSIQLHLMNKNFFDVNFKDIKSLIKGKNILVLGNPPWVTNSKLGELNSENLPAKSNFKNNKGLDAITGKGNFDIAEYITYKMQDVVKDENAHIALLLKCSVIKNIIFEQGKARTLAHCEQHNIAPPENFLQVLLRLCLRGNWAKEKLVAMSMISIPEKKNVHSGGLTRISYQIAKNTKVQILLTENQTSPGGQD